jgi:hypothetical protein
MATEDKIGEFISEDLGKLFRREQGLANSFKSYCAKHNKIFETSICMSASDPVLFTLQIRIKNKDNNDNNGEINRN